MKLSRSVMYAVRATLELARSNLGVPVPSSHLAAKGHIPERFLLQVLRQLVTHGILRSTSGPKGGYSMGRKPEEISLLNLIEAIDGPLDSAIPSLERGKQSVPGSKLQAALEKITLNSRKQLQAIKLSDLLGSRSRVKGGG
jgi:Rrf2 family protein